MLRKVSIVVVYGVGPIVVFVVFSWLGAPAWVCAILALVIGGGVGTLLMLPIWMLAIDAAKEMRD